MVIPSARRVGGRLISENHRYRKAIPMMEYAIYIVMAVVVGAFADDLLDLLEEVAVYLRWVLMAVGAVIVLPLWLPLLLFPIVGEQRERLIQGIAAGYYFSLWYFLNPIVIEVAVPVIGLGGACFFAGVALLLWSKER